jgi:3-keto-5-aminohexanoate cleavage enzyme
MRRRIMITVAPVARESHPDPEVVNPLTPEEVAEETLACEAAGAAQVHLHVRTETGEITHRTEVYTRTLDLIRARSNIIIQGSTGGFEKKLSLDERCSALDDPRTDVASLNMGSFNIGFDLPFINTGTEVAHWAEKIYARKAVPELEVFDTGMMNLVHDLLGRGLLRRPLNINFPLGYFAGALPRVENIIHLRNLMPEGACFGVVHNAMTDFTILAASIAAGARKIRVGFEDSLYYAPGGKARTNVDLVRKAAEMIRALGCEPMPVDEAREMYGLA